MVSRKRFHSIYIFSAYSHDFQIGWTFTIQLKTSKHGDFGKVETRVLFQLKINTWNNYFQYKFVRMLKYDRWELTLAKIDCEQGHVSLQTWFWSQRLFWGNPVELWNEWNRLIVSKRKKNVPPLFPHPPPMKWILDWCQSNWGNSHHLPLAVLEILFHTNIIICPLPKTTFEIWVPTSVFVYTIRYIVVYSQFLLCLERGTLLDASTNIVL